LAKIKGSALIARMNYIRQKCTPEQKERILAELDEDIKKIFNFTVFASQWYPLEHMVNLSLAIDKVMGKGDQALLWELGYFSAVEAVKGIYKVFFKIGTPEFVIRRSAQLWNRYYDSGKMTAVLLKKNQVSLVLEDFDSPMHEHCLAVQGWIQGVLELSGGKNVKIENSQCRAKRAKVCEFVASWE